MWFQMKVWLRNPANTLWLTPTFGALCGIIISVLAYMADFFWPMAKLPNVDADLIGSLLSVISSSMLAVSTFSLSIIVSAYASASNGVTPRATQLVMGDDNSRVAVASFISAFIFALIAQTTLGLEVVGNTGRFVLLVSTLLMLIYVVLTLIRWIGALSQLGRLGSTIAKIETVAKDSMMHWRAHPCFGAKCMQQRWQGGQELFAKQSRYITHIDWQRMSQWAQEHQAQIQVYAIPGTLVGLHTALLCVKGLELSEEDQNILHQCFVYNVTRDYEEDPRYGVIVLSEVALRALSVGVNDPGTTILVLTHLLGVMVDARAPEADETIEKTLYPNIEVNMFDERELVSQPFAPIIAFAAEDVVVSLRLLKVLHQMHLNMPEAILREEAKVQAQNLLDRSQMKMAYHKDYEQIQQTYAALFE